MPVWGESSTTTAFLPIFPVLWVSFADLPAGLVVAVSVAPADSQQEA